MKKILVSAFTALAMVVGGAVPAAQATPGDVVPTSISVSKNRVSFPITCNAIGGFTGTSGRAGDFTITVNGQPVAASGVEGQTPSVTVATDIPPLATVTLAYTQDPSNLIACTNPASQVGSFTLSGTAGAAPSAISGVTVSSAQSGRINASWTDVNGAGGYKAYYSTSPTGPWLGERSVQHGPVTWNGLTATSAYYVKVVVFSEANFMSPDFITTSAYLPDGSGNNPVYSAGGSSSSTPVVQVPVFKQPKFAMPSKIDVDATGKVSLSGKDMGVSTVLIGGKEQKIDTNSDEKLVFDTTGLAKGVHDLVMKGAFGTYTIQKAIQVGEAVATKVAAVSARQVGMAGGELSISGQGLEGTSQITMNGQVLEILSKTDSKVTFKIPASTVASVNSIMIEGSFVPVLFKNAFSYTK